MKTIIELPTSIHKELIKHLLPRKMKEEEAAFVFADVYEHDGILKFAYKDHMKATVDDFDFKSSYHIELSDGFRSKMFKRAHDLKSSIIEFHSHLHQEVARFSGSDWAGFNDFVPHTFWRLNCNSYAAVVVTKQSFDALIWWNEPHEPIGLDTLKVGRSKFLNPTNSSIKQKLHE